MGIIDRSIVTGAAFAAFVAFSGSALAQPAAADDRFLAGYATAVLAREFGVADAQVAVRDGVVRVRGATLAGAQGDRVRLALEGIPGVRGVTVGDAPPTLAAPAVAPPAAVARVEPPTSAVLPPGLLFEPLTADPRWPRFSAVYQAYRDDPDVEHAAAVSFGETFSLYRRQTGIGAFEVQFTAGVFSTFDLASDSFDLINSDFRVGIPVAWRWGDWSATARLYHQSSHLGDEYLLRRIRSATERVNVSYEAVDALLSWDLGRSWRLYGGGGLILRKEPDTLERPSVQAGVEALSPVAVLGGRLRPVAALDLQARAQDDWDPDVSLQAGVQLEGVALLGRRVQLLAQWYRGRNPNGQFYDRAVEFFGIGLSVKSE